MRRFKTLTIITLLAIISDTEIIYSQDENNSGNNAAPKAELVTPVPKAEPIIPNETVPRAEIVIPKTYPKAIPNLEYTENNQEKSKAILDYANFVYSQKQWSIANAYYLKFIEISPNDTSTPLAAYRLAETYLKQKNTEDAKKAYLKIVEKFSESEYFGPASYRLGSLAYSNENYKDAATFFNTAKKSLEKNSVKLSAAYYYARSLS